MAASRADVDRWIREAKCKKFKYIISVCDTYDHDDYPVYCINEQELLEKYKESDGKNMQRINEIIRIDPDGSVHEDLNIRTYNRVIPPPPQYRHPELMKRLTEFTKEVAEKKNKKPLAIEILTLYDEIEAIIDKKR